MSWLLFAVISYALYSVTNFIDKFLIEKRIQDPIAIVILGAFTYSILGALIFFFSGLHFVPLLQGVILLSAGLCLTFYLIPYFQALTLEDTSRVVPLFQFYPIIALVLSFLFLHERLNGSEIIGFIFVIVGGFILGTEKISGKLFSIRKSLFLMLLASGIYALSNVIFKFVTTGNFWSNFSYLTFGSAIGCFFLLFKKSYRANFQKQIKKLSMSTVSILGINSLVNLAAELCSFYAISIGSVALVSAVNGVQPFIVLMYGLILTLFFPKIVTEDIKKETIFVKILAATLLFVGVYFINR